MGTELIEKLAAIHGKEAVLATDIRESSDFPVAYQKLNVLDQPALEALVKEHQFEEVYHLAALLSATAEQNPAFAWKLNMEGLFHMLDLAKDGHIGKIFWPSSIAVFGPTTPRHQTPQHTVIEPTTVYGISKFAGERWCEYYHAHYGVDIRSIRYPGLIGYKSLPGGGTTDYAVDIFHQALNMGSYTCFLKEGTALPMMYMEDAIKATLDIMAAPAEKVKIRAGYNVAAMSFSPAEIAKAIQKHIPGFSISYEPDFRQKIAESWPASIDDSEAREHWGWQHGYDLERMVADMLQNLQKGI